MEYKDLTAEESAQKVVDAMKKMGISFEEYLKTYEDFIIKLIEEARPQWKIING